MLLERRQASIEAYQAEVDETYKWVRASYKPDLYDDQRTPSQISEEAQMDIDVLRVKLLHRTGKMCQGRLTLKARLRCKSGTISCGVSVLG